MKKNYSIKDLFILLQTKSINLLVSLILAPIVKNPCICPLNISIYEFDINNDFKKRIYGKSSDISSVSWKFKDAKIFSKDGEIILENVKNYSYKSMYDIKKIKSLYSNLDTISFWNLKDEI